MSHSRDSRAYEYCYVRQVGEGLPELECSELTDSSKNAFALMAGGDNPDYKINIDEAVLFARKVKLNPAVQMGHVKALEKGAAKYPLRRVHCKKQKRSLRLLKHGHIMDTEQIERLLAAYSYTKNVVVDAQPKDRYG
ncbi:hypothetical protein NP493_2455g00003 [Ridgeia piscesae]|uniref:Uncharacterized protein n=1 Tax=Ridgeia piscesae TaxID=27915 RepID=A0AAD9N1W6_RIDPI|nr:hypothetical protein NP493_2455g00003 [Ridgeia piscesae]